MSERDTYPTGVPCWVTNLQHDVPAAAAFYAQLFGWEMQTGPADLAPYALGRLRGHVTAAESPEGVRGQVRRTGLHLPAEELCVEGGRGRDVVLQVRHPAGDSCRVGVAFTHRSSSRAGGMTSTTLT